MPDRMGGKPQGSSCLHTHVLGLYVGVHCYAQVFAGVQEIQSQDLLLGHQTLYQLNFPQRPLILFYGGDTQCQSPQ